MKSPLPSTSLRQTGTFFNTFDENFNFPVRSVTASMMLGSVPLQISSTQSEVGFGTYIKVDVIPNSAGGSIRISYWMLSQARISAVYDPNEDDAMPINIFKSSSSS